MATPSNSVFISYRRDVAGIYVLAVYQHLSTNQIDAFYDVESIKAGQFGEIILGQIAARPYFMPVFTPGTLDRCINAGDWVRREIEHAISLKRVLIPLHTPDFDFGDLERYLPHLAEAIRGYNMVELPTKQLKYFKYAMQDVVENYLKPIALTLATPSPTVAAEVARSKQSLDAAPTVTEKQLTAQEYFNRALARSETDVDGKIADYTEAIRLKPDFAEAYYNRGIVRKASGNLDSAIQDYTEAIHLKPDDADAYINRGVARQANGDVNGAIQDFTEVIRLKPDYAEAYNNRGITRNDNSDAEIADYTEAIRLKPDFAEAYYNRGVARRAKGDVDGAIKDYTEAIRLKPDYASAYYNRGNARNNNSDAEIADYTEAIRLKPDYASAYYNRGIAFQANGKSAAATTDYRRVLELMPNHPQAQAMRNYIAKYGKR